MELLPVDIHAFIDQLWKMALQSLLEISVRGSDVQNLLTVLDHLHHQRKSLPEDLQVPNLAIAAVNLIAKFKELAPGYFFIHPASPIVLDTVGPLLSEHQDRFGKVDAQIPVERDHHIDPEKIAMDHIPVGPIHRLHLKTLGEEKATQFIITIGHFVRGIPPELMGIEDIGSGQDQPPSHIEKIICLL
jgi:hypothetical protein